MSRPSMLWLYGLIGAFIIGYYVFGDVNDTPVPSDWATVERMVEKGEVEKIQVVNRDQAQVFLKKEAVEQYRRDTVDKRFRRLPETGVQLLFTIGSVDSFREDLKAAEQQSGQVVPVVYENKANDWTNVLINLLPWVLIIGGWIFVMRSMSRGAGGGAGGGIMNVGKAKAQVFDKDNSKRVTFKDVAGLEEAKVEIMEIVDFLKKSDKYKELGAKIPKGALLVGPPGTGKTLLALAAALGKLTDYKQILLARPIVALSNKDLGFLPGDANEKVAPYMQPLFDNLNVIKHQFASNSSEVKRLEDMQKSDQLVIEALAFIRGRSLSETYCIIDEAQNLTPHEIKTIITRAGEGTKMVFTGDIQQIDQPYLDSQSNGLVYMIDRMRDQNLFAHVNLVKGERSQLSELASNLM